MDYVPFFDYVFKYHESTHSGVLSRAITLDTQYRNVLPIERLHALEEIAPFVTTSITAYKAVEWYALLDEMTYDAPRYFVDTAKEILARSEKPKTYLSSNYQQTEVT